MHAPVRIATKANERRHGFRRAAKKACRSVLLPNLACRYCFPCPPTTTRLITFRIPGVVCGTADTLRPDLLLSLVVLWAGRSEAHECALQIR